MYHQYQRVISVIAAKKCSVLAVPCLAILAVVVGVQSHHFGSGQTLEHGPDLQCAGRQGSLASKCKFSQVLQRAVTTRFYGSSCGRK